jgi:hypothetical protein
VNPTYMKRHCAPVCQSCAQLIEGNQSTKSLRSSSTYPKTKKGEDRLDNEHRAIMDTTTDRDTDQTKDITPFGEAQEVPIGPVGEEARRILQNMQVYMQQTVLVKEEYGHVKDHCKCNDRRCALWATEGKYKRNDVGGRLPNRAQNPALLLVCRSLLPFCVATFCVIISLL